MSYVDDAKQSGAEPIWVVDIVLDFCSLAHGVSPCPATGEPCFNTRATCQAPDAYSRGSKVYRFIEPRSSIPVGFNAFPFLAGPPSFSPSELDVSGGLGLRADVTLQLMDAPHHDITIDPYVNQRQYDAMERGTFFGKLMARNPFYIGRPVRVYAAHVVDDQIILDNADRMDYVLEKISGPDSSGRVSVSCKDPLKLADNNRSLCPLPSQGRTATEIEENTTEVFLLPPGIGASYPPQGKASMGEEIVRFVRDGDRVVIVDDGFSQSQQGRGIDNTARDSHSEDTTFQLVKEFEPDTVAQHLRELLVDFAGIDEQFIPVEEWESLQSEIGFLYSAQVSEPEGVKDLITQLLKSSGVFIYWDERESLVQLLPLRATPDIENLPLLNDDAHFIADSVSVQRMEDKRLSQTWYYRGLIDSTQDLEEKTNYTNLLTTIAPEAEGDDQYGQRRIRRIWARWTPPTAAAAAFTVGGRTLNRFRKTPRKIQFQLDTKDADVWVGDLLSIEHRNIQDETGAVQRLPIQITRAAHADGARMSYQALEYDVPETGEFPGEDVIIIDQNSEDVNLRQIYETTIGPVGTDGIDVFVIVIDGVQVTGRPAITGGGFPSGSTVTFINRGFIAGRGGEGGVGGSAIAESEVQSAFPGEDGQDGGVAINLTEDWILDNTSGEIYGGSGGGGGGGASVETSGLAAASGGGGGGGQSLPAFPASGGDGGDVIGEREGPGDDGGDGTGEGAGEGGDGGDLPNSTASGGNGGKGGEYAESGSSGSAGSGGDQNSAGGSGGQPGDAIVTNGYDLEITEPGVIIGIQS